MEMVKGSVQLKKDQYKIRLPFRTSHVTMPNNFSIAKQRVSSLKRKILKDEHFHK